MSYLSNNNDYKKIIIVHCINNFLRGIYLSVIIPGLLWTVLSVRFTQLKVSETFFLLGIGVLESSQVVGKLLIYVYHYWAFSVKVYIRFVFLLILAALLYISCFYQPGIVALELSLAIQGLCIGCLDKIEAILITEINSGTADKDKELMKIMKCLGIVIGPILGYFQYTFMKLELFGIAIDKLSVPGYIQLICGLVMLVTNLFMAVRIFTPTTLQVPTESKQFNRTESLALINSSVQIQKTIDKAHLSIFTAMFIALIFSLSRSIKEVALPVLSIKNSEKFSNCKCLTTYDLDVIYLGFALLGTFEAIGTFCLYRLRNKLENKYQIFIPLVLGLIGQTLMIADSNIDLPSLISGISLQAFAVSLGAGVSGNFLHEIIGNEPPAYFSVVYMLLELLGSLIGPFWAIQAYLVKCSLCFTFISFCVGISIIMMGFSIRDLLRSESSTVEKPLLEHKSSVINTKAIESDRSSLLDSIVGRKSSSLGTELTNLKKSI